MKAAEDGRRYDLAHVLDGAMNRSGLVERSMSPQLIIVGGILRQNLTQVRFAQDNQMVDAIASDRSNQPFGEAGRNDAPRRTTRCTRRRHHALVRRTVASRAVVILLTQARRNRDCSRRYP